MQGCAGVPRPFPRRGCPAPVRMAFRLFRPCPGSVRLWAVLLAAPWLASCGGTPVVTSGPDPEREVPSTWSYRSSQARFVRDANGESRASRELLEFAKAASLRGETDDACDALRAIHRSDVEPTLKTEALLEEARTLAAAGRYRSAHSAYLEFVTRYPQSPLLPGALREAFRNAFAYAAEKEAPGVQSVRDLLNKYPREDFSGENAFQLAEFFFKEEKYDLALAEFEVVRREYPRTPWAEASLFRIGLSHLRRFRGIDYDPRPIVEAQRTLERFLTDYPTSSRAAEARQRLNEVKGLRAEKALLVADYYDARGRTKAAWTMYTAVSREFPGTEAAARAKVVLQDYPVPEPETPPVAATTK
jgi:outer membrane assembly lipoprotein YfiO